jgi:hypothetical protein
MAQLATKIELYANRKIDFFKEVRLVDNSDGKGAFIAEWNLDIAKPTMAQLDAFEAQAKIYEQNLINEEQNKAINKQSALTKLSALGLTEAEIKAILG